MESFTCYLISQGEKWGWGFPNDYASEAMCKIDCGGGGGGIIFYVKWLPNIWTTPYCLK